MHQLRAASTPTPAAPTADPETYLSPAQLADLLNVPVGSVYQWNARGTGPTFIRLGKHVRYRLSDVTEWLEQLQAKRLQVTHI